MNLYMLDSSSDVPKSKPFHPVAANSSANLDTAFVFVAGEGFLSGPT